MTQAPAYNMDYDGVYEMIWFDREAPLLRWFNAHKQSRYDWEPAEHQWLTVEEEHRFTPRGKRLSFYIGTIASDGPEPPREVRFEPGAPPPPIFHLPPRIPYGQHLRERAEREKRWKAEEERRRLSPAPTPVPSNAVPVPSQVTLEDSAPKVPRLRRNV